MRLWTPMLLTTLACATEAPQVTPEAERVALAPDLALVDADGTVHALADQLGAPVVLDFSAAWCKRCQEAALEAEAVHQARPDVVVWTVLFDNAVGDDPAAEDLAAWTQAFGLSHTVLADVDKEGFNAFGGGHQPIFHIVDAEGRLAWTDDASTAEQVLSALDAL